MATSTDETTIEATSSVTNVTSSSISTTLEQFTTLPTTTSEIKTSTNFFTNTSDIGKTTTNPQGPRECSNCTGLLAATVCLSVLLVIAIIAIVILALLHFTNKLDRFKWQRRVKKKSTAPSVLELNQSRPTSAEDPDNKITQLNMEQETSKPNQYTKERSVTKPKKTPPLPPQDQSVSAEYVEFEADPPPRDDENEQEYLPLGEPPMDGEAYEEITPASKETKPKPVNRLDVIDPPPPIPVPKKVDEPGPDEIYMNPPVDLYENYDGEVPIDPGFENAKCVDPYVNQKVVEANKNDKDYLIMNKHAR